jgi:hypothetical protein
LRDRPVGGKGEDLETNKNPARNKNIGAFEPDYYVVSFSYYVASFFMHKLDNHNLLFLLLIITKQLFW